MTIKFRLRYVEHSVFVPSLIKKVKSSKLVYYSPIVLIIVYSLLVLFSGFNRKLDTCYKQERVKIVKSFINNEDCYLSHHVMNRKGHTQLSANWWWFFGHFVSMIGFSLNVFLSPSEQLSCTLSCTRFFFFVLYLCLRGNYWKNWKKRVKLEKNDVTISDTISDVTQSCVSIRLPPFIPFGLAGSWSLSQHLWIASPAISSGLWRSYSTEYDFLVMTSMICVYSSSLACSGCR